MFPFSSVIARMRPTLEPATRTSPTLRVPFCTSNVATGPRPLSRRASITVPLAALSGLALSSFISDTRSTISSSLSMPSPVWAETGTQITSPPHSSGTRPCSVSCCIMRSGLASGLSILLIATIIEILASFAWLIASTVCGIIPSSAATTSIAISVTSAPLARIEVNAACPGVSKKVIELSFVSTLYAPICCVMPPASPLVTLVRRIASNIEVLPWSTCPITTTIGSRCLRFWSVSSLSSIMRSSIVTTTSRSTFACNSDAIRYAVSKSIS